MDAKYPLQMRAMHWLLALIILCLLAVGLYMESLSRDDQMRPTLYAMHKSFGVTVFLLLLLRIFFRVRLGVPALPDVISMLERRLALLGHYAFYVFMIVMPLSGFLMTNAFGFAVKLFGIELPRLIGPDRDLGRTLETVHKFSAYLLIALIVLHVAGVIKHRLKDKVNLLQRMI